MDVWHARTLEDLLAGGCFMPAQLSVSCVWSPEKRLGGAVLESALVAIRDHHGDPKYRQSVVEDLRWVASDDDAPTFSFVRLCQLLGLEPDWVRDVVRRWMARPAPCAPRRLDLLNSVDSPARARRRTSTVACPGRSVRGRRARTAGATEPNVRSTG